MVKKIWMYCLIYVCFVFSVQSFAVSEFSSPVSTDDMSPVQAGLSLFNSKKYSDAIIEWHKALQSEKYSNSPEVYLNLGLTEFYLKDYGASLAHLRKAQSLNPLSLKIHKTINFVSHFILEKEFYRVKNTSVFKLLITWVPKYLWIFMFIGLICAGTLAGMRHDAQGISPKLFFKSYSLFLSLSLFPIFMLFLQNSLEDIAYATLVGTAPSPIYTHPNTKAPELGTLQVGDAFEILNINPKEATIKSKDWVAITTSEIPLGWMKTKNYLVHGGKIDPSLSTH